MADFYLDAVFGRLVPGQSSIARGHRNRDEPIAWEVFRDIYSEHAFRADLNLNGALADAPRPGVPETFLRCQAARVLPEAPLPHRRAVALNIWRGMIRATTGRTHPLPIR